MKLKELERPAVQAWSPASQYPVYLATGMMIIRIRSYWKSYVKGKRSIWTSNEHERKLEDWVAGNHIGHGIRVASYTFLGVASGGRISLNLLLFAFHSLQYL